MGIVEVLEVRQNLHKWTSANLFQASCENVWWKSINAITSKILKVNAIGCQIATKWTQLCWIVAVDSEVLFENFKKKLRSGTGNAFRHLD